MDNTERSDSVYVNTYGYVNIQILSKIVGSSGNFLQFTSTEEKTSE